MYSAVIAYVMEFTNSKGKKYYLHRRETVLPRNRIKAFTYFFRTEKKEDICESLPVHLKIQETRTGLPIVKRI